MKCAPASWCATALTATSGNLRPASCGCRSVRSSKSTSFTMLDCSQMGAWRRMVAWQRAAAAAAAAAAAERAAALSLGALLPAWAHLVPSRRDYSPSIAAERQEGAAGAGAVPAVRPRRRYRGAW